MYLVEDVIGIVDYNVDCLEWNALILMSNEYKIESDMVLTEIESLKYFLDYKRKISNWDADYFCETMLKKVFSFWNLTDYFFQVSTAGSRVYCILSTHFIIAIQIFLCSVLVCTDSLLDVCQILFYLISVVRILLDVCDPMPQIPAIRLVLFFFWR